MKLTAFLLTAACIQVAARTAGQTVTLDLKDAPVQKVFKEISRQTGVSIVYAESLFKDMKPVTIRVKNATVEEVLDRCLKGQPFNYMLKGISIVIGPEPTAGLEPADIQEEPPPPIDIKGRILNENGEPVVASIVVKGTQNGTTSDADGYFELKNVDENATLVITGVSIQSREVKVNGRVNISVTVKIAAAEGEGVTINAGYYRVKDREKTGSISRVDAKTIEKQPVSNVLQTLQGRVTGLYIQQNSGLPGGNFRVFLRGINSILNGNSPLYIVDGVPFPVDPLTTTFTSGSNLGGQTGAAGASPLNTLNPLEIESIEVLKDADATAIYGSRGANGVVLITTKKGKPGKTNAGISLLSGVSSCSYQVKLMNSSQYMEMRREAIANDGGVINPWDYDLNGTWDTTRYTDWIKEFTGGNAPFTNIQTTLSGGNSTTQFQAMAGYQEHGTVFPGSFKYSRINTRLNLQHVSVNNKFKADFSVGYGSDKNNLPFSSLAGAAVSLPPVAPSVYNSDGTLNWANSTWENPLAKLQQKYKAVSNNLIANAVLSYQFLKGLKLSANIGFNELNLKDQVTTPATKYYDPIYNAGPEYSSIMLNNSKNQSWIVEPQLSYETMIGQGNLSVLTGLTFQNTEFEQIVQSGTGFSSEALIDNIRAAATVSFLNYAHTVYRYNAIFSRVNYNLGGKYILNGTFRRDGSSRFGPGKQFGNFGAVGLAWIFSKEPFFQKHLSWLSFGKIKLSYGTSGNDQIGDYGYLDTYGLTTTYFGIIGLSPQGLFNQNYAWEINRKLETGMELALLNNRIKLTAGYYRNKSSNQLVGYPLPRTTGFTSIQANLDATVQNSGFELDLSTTNIRTQSFSWNTGFNITIPRNKLISFPDLEKSTYANRYIVGEPITISKRYVLLGVDPQTGIYQFMDFNNDGVISSADRQSFANISQTLYGGFVNSVQYKGWEFDLFFQFVKQKGYDFLATNFATPGGRYQFPTAILEGRWQRPGDIASLQKFSSSDFDVYDAQSLYSDSDATVVDASFIRLKNISIAYNLSQKWTKIKARLYVQGQNLLTFTKYKGSDPEIFNSITLPPLKIFTAGIQINL